MSETSTAKVTLGHIAHFKEASDNEATGWDLTVKDSTGSIIVKKKVSAKDLEINFRNVNFGQTTKREAYRRINEKLGEG